MSRFCACTRAITSARSSFSTPGMSGSPMTTASVITSNGVDTPMRVAVAALRNSRLSRVIDTGISAAGSPAMIRVAAMATRRNTLRGQSAGAAPTRAPSRTSGSPRKETTGRSRAAKPSISGRRRPW
jgi:hypothetical protein